MSKKKPSDTKHNQELMKAAKAAIDAVLSDLSVPVKKAIENMEELASDIEGNIHALSEDLERESDE